MPFSVYNYKFHDINVNDIGNVRGNSFGICGLFSDHIKFINKQIIFYKQRNFYGKEYNYNIQYIIKHISAINNKSKLNEYRINVSKNEEGLKKFFICN